MKTYQITLTFTEPLLGTVPKSQGIYADYVASKADDANVADEMATVPDVEEKGWTSFHMLDGQPILYDYVIKGFFKDACGMLRRVHKSPSSRLRAYKKEIDGLLFVEPRQIRLMLPQGAELSTLERPLRATGPQGERVALARSDTCPPGTTLTFTVTILGGSITEDLLQDWLSYGQYRGLGQWRNAGYGRFTYEIKS